MFFKKKARIPLQRFRYMVSPTYAGKKGELSDLIAFATQAEALRSLPDRG
jgi:hypothetical protein